MKHSLKILAILIIPFSALAEPTNLTGVVTHIRDGDTIEVEDIPIRLNGISAPELHEPVGKRAKTFISNLVSGKSVRCELNGERTHDRLVGVCYLGGADIGASVIAAGLALDCPRYSGGRYARYETSSASAAIKLPKYCK